MIIQIPAGAGVKHPIALPKGYKHVTLFAAANATVRVDARDGTAPADIHLTEKLTHMVTVPAHINAVIVTRVDAGTGDVSVAIGTS